MILSLMLIPDKPDLARLGGQIELRKDQGYFRYYLLLRIKLLRVECSIYNEAVCFS